VGNDSRDCGDVFILRVERNADCDLSGGFMPQDQAPGVGAGADALSAPPEPWEAWETVLVLGSIGVGVLALLALGWAVTRFILP
jgi:hypothetical protein